MPAYSLSTSDASPAFLALDELARGFIECAFFQATDSSSPDEFFTPEAEEDRIEGRSDGTIPSGSDASDLPDDEIARVVAFLAPLRARMSAEIEAACERDGYDMTRVGHDLCYTIAGAGVGFWDRKELEAGGLGDRMADLCGRGEIDLYAEGDADSYVVRFGSLYSSASK